jgi:hypothetical protein
LAHIGSLVNIQKTKKPANFIAGLTKFSTKNLSLEVLKRVFQINIQFGRPTQIGLKRVRVGTESLILKLGNTAQHYYMYIWQRKIKNLPVEFKTALDQRD